MRASAVMMSRMPTTATSSAPVLLSPVPFNPSEARFIPAQEDEPHCRGVPKPLIRKGQAKQRETGRGSVNRPLSAQRLTSVAADGEFGTKLRFVLKCPDVGDPRLSTFRRCVPKTPAKDREVAGGERSGD